ncbi:unnamed protein product [Rotaria sp. Silwood1]|nr:unnamed protein product [Rotaria sp. Silwood1]
MNLSSDKLNVLMIIDFLQPCSTAIALFTLTSDLPRISQHEDEEEVLILPETIFRVKHIEEDRQTRLQTIYLEHFNTEEQEMNIKFLIIGAVITTTLALGLGLIIGHFGISKKTSDTSWKYNRLTRPADPKNYRTFIDSIQAANIEANLKDLTSRPHIAGQLEDLQSAQVIEKQWKLDGLQVTKSKYNVLLSYPNDTELNRVNLKLSNGTIIFQTSGTEKIYDPTQPKTVNPFLAYTPNGIVSSTKLFYANYGGLDDLHKLASVVGNSSLNGSIIIMRYGRIFRGDKVIHAQYFGAVGAILYNDPANYAPLGTTPDQVYDQKWYMPPSGVQRGSTFTLNGDPLTPLYPSTDSVSFLPKIPAQPIGYSEAEIILQYLQGAEVDSEWRGSLRNVTYRYGGELRDASDAWNLGSVDPTSGTATMLEITRVLGQMYKNGFRPRRSLMFCSWGAEEYGLVGSVEYVEVPSAYDPVGQTIYDKWMKVDRNPATNEPNIRYGLGSGSDFFSFDQLVGSSNMDFIALFLSETPVLQFNVTRYTTALMQAMNNLQPKDPKILDPLRNAINDFSKAAQDFVTRSKSIDSENPYEIRVYNDQVLQLERAFLNPLGQGRDYTDFKHIIYAPAKGNRYAAIGFPAVSDAIANGDSTEIINQVAIATYFVRGALSVLKEVHNFFSYY